ncbi:MAG: sugar ABC transporter substrate-binding protein [Lachnospiraceae bacterium]
MKKRREALQPPKFKTSMLLVIIGLISILLLTVFSGFYYKRTISDIGLKSTLTPETYSWHYTLILENYNSTFWQSVYTSAQEQANKNDAYIEVMSPDLLSDYTALDFMKMSIAAQVDGIILEYDGSAGLEEQINLAEDNGIPVITIGKDAPSSKRQSYVGINSYQSSQAYSDAVLSLIDSDTSRIMILTSKETSSDNQEMLSTEINTAIMKHPEITEAIKVEYYYVEEQSVFDAEEAIRTIFLTPEGPPDILLCLQDIYTESAYQALIDYNLVGSVDIIGYYPSSTIIEAVENGIIPIVFELDAQQIGRFSITAMTDYKKEGRTNNYYNVTLNLIDQSNVAAYKEVSDEG